jgi:outer membrane protein assembly factor BamB
MKALDWPQWRGPGGKGVSEEKNLPSEWSPTRNIQWKTPISGRGHSSPIVSGNKVFLTTAIEGPIAPEAKPVKHVQNGKEYLDKASVGGDRRHTLKVLCLDVNTGKTLWEQTAYEGTVYDYRHKKNSYASTTPVTDGRYVYAYFGAEGLYCYDFNGKRIWSTSLGGIATMGMGVGSSPVLAGDLLILQCDQDNGVASFIAAVDKRRGKQVWRVPRNTLESWTTPVVARAPQRSELIVSARELVISYDPKTGQEWWRCKGLGSNPVPSPLFDNDLVYVTATNPPQRVMAIRLGASGDLSDSPQIVWRYGKGTAQITSPILYQGYFYSTTDTGLLTCLDARTGDIKYEGGRVPIPSTFTASPVAFEGKILLTNEDGDTFVVKAGPVHEILGTNSINEPVYASPAISNGRIFIRGERNLYCISKRNRERK